MKLKYGDPKIKPEVFLLVDYAVDLIQIEKKYFTYSHSEYIDCLTIAPDLYSKKNTKQKREQAEFYVKQALENIHYWEALEIIIGKMLKEKMKIPDVINEYISDSNLGKIKKPNRKTASNTPRDRKLAEITYAVLYKSKNEKKFQELNTKPYRRHNKIDGKLTSACDIVSCATYRANLENGGLSYDSVKHAWKNYNDWCHEFYNNLK